jgi:hypothetical protein
MNCQEFWKSEPHELEHLKACRDCAARYERRQRLVVGLKALGAQMRRVEAPARVESRLVAAFSAQTRLEGVRTRGSWWLMGTWAAAVAATVALAVFVMSPKQPERTHHITRSTMQLAALELPADITQIPGSDGGESDFLPLPNAERIAPNEEVNLVRVEVPRSAMIALGYTVSEERASEPVEADVMLDADGVARAVRFLER